VEVKINDTASSQLG